MVGPWPGRFGSTFVPSNPARCLRISSALEGNFDLGACHDLGDRIVKEIAHKRAAQSLIGLLLFGREVYFSRGAGDLAALDLLGRIPAYLLIVTLAL
jgi:hypothetical protein